IRAGQNRLRPLGGNARDWGRFAAQHDIRGMHASGGDNGRAFRFPELERNDFGESTPDPIESRVPGHVLEAKDGQAFGCGWRAAKGEAQEGDSSKKFTAATKRSGVRA